MRAALLAALAVVAAAPLGAQQTGTLSGRVVNAATRQAVEGAIVLVPSDSVRRTVSDGTGRWQLPDVALPVRLRVQRVGYAPTVVDVRRDGIVVALEPLPVALDAMVVTAARREQLLTDAVPETRLLTRADLQATGAADLAGALTQTTGVQLEGGIPAGAGVVLEGLGSQRVLILLDGQPLTGRIGGNFDLSRLPTSMIRQVEIVRGPQATLYGSDAMGGVINIITQEPSPTLAAEATVLGGTQGRVDGSATVRGSAGALGFVLDLGGRTENLAPGMPGDEATLARRWNVAPRVRWRVAPALTIEASGLVVDERQRYRTGQLFHFSDNLQAAARLGAVWQSRTRRLAPTVSWSRFDHLSRAATGSAPASDSGQLDVQQLVVAEVAYSTPALLGTSDGGVQVRHESIRADRVEGVRRSIAGVEAWAQQTWYLGMLSVSPGLRFSASERWGRALTPGIATLVRPTPALSLRASLAAGYRAPDFKELYLDFVNAAAGYAVRGNPGLQPEHSRNATVGVELVGRQLSGRVSAFHNRYRGFIDVLPPDANNVYSYGNIGRGYTRGFDVEVGRTLHRARLTAGYALLDTRDDSTGTPLLGRARHSGRLSAAWDAGPARLSVMVLYTGRTPTERDDSTRAITAWRAPLTRLDLRATAPLRRWLSLVLGVENLLNRRMDAAWPGFTGRRLYGGVRYAADSPGRQGPRPDETGGRSEPN